jgi:hypothetical protein
LLSQQNDSYSQPLLDAWTCAPALPQLPDSTSQIGQLGDLLQPARSCSNAERVADIGAKRNQRIGHVYVAHPNIRASERVDAHEMIR